MMSLCLSYIPKQLFLSVCQRRKRGSEGEREGGREERETSERESALVLLGSLSEDIIFSVFWTG